MKTCKCPDCGSKKYIFYPQPDHYNEMQCSNCGKYLSENDVKFYRDAYNEYDFEKQEAVLNDRIREKNASLLMSIYSSLNMIHDYDLGTEKSACTNIYRCEDNSYIVSHCVDYKHSTAIAGTVMFISDTLPVWSSTGGASSYSIPVKGPDQLVFTGATVGGITTGGFHIQEGRTTMQTVTYSRTELWQRAWGVSFSLTKGYRCLYEDNSIIIYSDIASFPRRYKPFIRSWNSRKGRVNNYIWITNGPKDVKQPKKWEDYSSLSIDFPLIRLIKDFLDGSYAMSDEEYYQKAVSKSAKRTQEDMLEAASMFSLIKSYEDSKIKLETCLREAKRIPPQKNTSFNFIKNSLFRKKG